MLLSIKNLLFKHHPLKEDSICPWCQSKVLQGACICKGCNAEHSYIVANFFIRIFYRLAFLFSILMFMIVFMTYPHPSYVSALVYGVLAFILFLFCIVMPPKKSSWARRCIK